MVLPLTFEPVVGSTKSWTTIVSAAINAFVPVSAVSVGSEASLAWFW